MSAERPDIFCTPHGKVIRLAGGSPEVVHKNDGSHCNAVRFLAGTIDRPQAMALLILAKGLSITEAAKGT